MISSRRVVARVLCAVAVVLIPTAAFLVGGVPAPGAAEEKIVRIAVARGVNHIGLWGIQQFASKYGLRAELIATNTNAEMQRYIQAGQVEVGALGYQSPAIMADQNVSTIKIIAGIYNGGQNLIVRKGVDLKSWKDLEGKKIGRPPGTYVAILFTLAAQANGVDLEKVHLVNTTAVGTAELQALKNGDLDGLLLWSPVVDRAVVDGYAYYPPCCDIGTSKDFGAGNQLLGANTEFLKDRPTAVKFLKAFVEAKEFYRKNQDKTVEVLTEVTGMGRPVIIEALKHSVWESRVDILTAISVAKQGPRFGFAKTDTSDRVTAFFDMSYLAEAIGRPVEQLTSFGR
jgi:ABC-type nitrate/sulfonate/bicarbonate transport system substrate-binding protein